MKHGILFVTILLLILASCSREGQQMKTLAEIDSLTLTNADSAKATLNGMSKEMNGASDEVKAYYHLLQVKADDKTSVPHTSDSLICSVAEYYEKTGNIQRLPETYYYIGRANADMKNGEKALFYLQKAMIQDSTYLTPHLRGCICAQIGYIYLRNALFDEAKKMQELSYCYFKEEGDTLFMRYCREDIHTIDVLKEKMVIDSALTNATKLKIMQINEKLRSDVLNDKNTVLQQDYDQNSRWLIIVGIIIVVLIVLGAVGAFFLMKKRKQIKTERENNNAAERQQPAMTKRLFYDKEISESLSEHIKQNKVLKPADWELIEERLLTEFPEFKDKLYSLYNLSEMEFHTCLLIKLEVSPSNMAKLMATSNSAISQNRLRMQQKVFNGVGTAKDWDNYVMSL